MGGWKRAWRMLRWSVAQRGLAGTARVMLGRLRRRPAVEALHPFDQAHGTETGGVIGGGALASGSPNDRHITAYAGVPPRRLEAALAEWKRCLPADRAVADYTFVDLGCGKGRALLLASFWPFQQVIGVELNGDLAATAQRNVGLWAAAHPDVAPIEVRCGDATEVVYGAGPLLVYLYNPFSAELVREVLAGLARHAAAAGAEVEVIYQNEAPETPLRGDARFRLLWRGEIALTAAGAAADPVTSAEDVTGLYRWVG